jgi:3-phosphoshikimate 1-carboxyvinyltransferase
MRPGKWMLTGSDRMKQRPIGILVDALRSLGADIDFLAKPGYPPILIRGKELTGNEVTIDPGESSQYVSALMMIAPNLSHGLTIHFKGKTVSTPYMQMTIGLMKQLGAKVKAGKHGVTVKPGGYHPVEATVEGDWSAAAFWYEAAVLAGEIDLELKGLWKESMQGDSLLAAIYENFGVDTTFSASGIRLTRNRQKIDGFFFNFNDHPDIAPAVIVTCAVMGIRGHFEGLKSLRIKESDRLVALKSELEKLGLKAEIPERKDDLPTLDFKPTIPKNAVQSPIETYGDHRMAMTFAPLAIRLGPIRINNPEVVVKSYPQFWDHLKELGFKVEG